MEKVSCLAAVLILALGGGLGFTGFEQMEPGSAPCRSGWRTFNGTCYLFGYEEMRWLDAVDLCSTMGSTLVTINSKDEMRFLRDTIMQNYQYDFWVGLINVSSEGRWMNIDGTTPYLQWGRGQPDNAYDGENCGEIEGAVDYHLNDGRCSNWYSNSFICEQGMRSTVNPTNTSDWLPDIDECTIGAADCDRNADCNNTEGAFICSCKPGFTGNGTTCQEQNKIETVRSGLILGVTIGTPLLVISIIIIVVVTLIARRRLRTSSSRSDSSNMNAVQMVAYGSNVPPPESTDEVDHGGLEARLSADLRLLVEDCKLFNVTLTFDKFIGTGFFGKVYECQMKREDGSQIMVAVKMLKYSYAVLSEVENFLKEATVMRNFHHPNVLELLGINWNQNQPMIVLPLMENGDLKAILKREDLNFTVGDLLHFGIQVCCGMEYLESLKFVHRDLSARNCMVSSTFVVKISDFGLSVDVYAQDYYRTKDVEKPLPIRWMAIECILEGLYTIKSDVWSFGVTMWEILTRGSLPYPAIESYDIRRCIMLGERLHQPRFCPNAVYDIIRTCWLEEPYDRPSFSSLTIALKSILNPPDIVAGEATYERVYTAVI